MANVMDIARSAIGAYRTALSVTSENIANVNTEGYRRRDVLTSQIGGAQTTVTTVATGGQGVKVDMIRRAFDSLMSERLRTSTSDVSSATVTLDATRAVESALLPNTGGIDAALENFFASTGSLASSPADTSLRRVVIEAGRTLASAFQGIAAGLLRLRDDTVAAAELSAQHATNDLHDLNELQLRFTSNAGTMGALNPLHDERDRLLSSLAEHLGITVDLDPAGRATVSLGVTGGGPILLGEGGPANLTVTGEPDLTLRIARDGSVTESRMIGTGALGGYVAALGAIDATLQEVDALARKMSAEMNAVHAAGLDLTGAPGGDMFSLEGWQMTRAAGNQGYARATILPTGTATTGPITLVRDAAQGVWRAEDAQGNVLGSADRLLVLPGVTIEIEGEPANGDRLIFTPSSGRAANMRFLPEVPARLAAAVATLVAPAPGNIGSGSVAMERTTLAPPAVPLLSSVLEGAQGAAGAVTLLSAGVVGYIPAGTSALSLASLGSQASADFALTDAEAATVGTLSLTLDGTVHSFALTPRPAGWTAAQLAAALTEGQFTTAAGDTFAALGLAAAGRNGLLSIARAEGPIAAATLDGTSATLSPASPQGGTLQIFTREGRQIAGTPLSVSEVALLFSTANGFLPDAEYVTDYLQAPGGIGYRGLSLTGTQGTGLHAATMDLHPAVTWSGSVEATASPARNVTLEIPGRAAATLILPQGSTAARLAEMLGDAAPGLTAQAETAAMLTVSGDGPVSFFLEGTNGTPLAISGDVAGGRLDALLLSINALSASTGIRAELAPGGSRLLLRQPEGHDIRITDFRHGNGATATLSPATAEGQPAGTPVTLDNTLDSARLSGRVTLIRTQGFTVTVDGARYDSGADALQGGLVTSATSAAGAVRSLTFALDPALDVTSAAPDGSAALAGPTRFGLTVASRSVTLDTGAGVGSAADVAQGLAAKLRDGMPVASLSGGAVPVLPSNGASTVVRLDGQDYVLRMENGSVTVVGPETGRLAASFDAQMRLQLTVSGGSTDAAFITVPAGPSGAAFGLSALRSPVTRLTGQPATPPATITVEIGSTQHMLSITAGPSVTLPPGFPGSASVGADGAITVELPATADPARILPGAAAAGFGTLGVALAAIGDRLVLQSSDGTPVAADVTTAALVGQRLTLTDLPPEDLIVVMTGSGTLRLTGSLTEGPPPTGVSPVEFRILDTAARRVGLFDIATGHSIATRVLDADGGTEINGLSIALTGNPAAGDAFRLTNNRDGRNDGRALDAILALRFPDLQTGKGGFARILSDLQSETGSRAVAAGQRLSAVTAVNDTIRRADAEQGAVDLDREAARLLELQQNYQAAAQIMAVAKEMFDTLINSV